MRIFGIDPGYGIVGWGILDYDNVNFKVVKYGAVRTDKDKPFDERLREIFEDMNTILDKFSPDCVSIEKLYFNTNITTGIAVAEARGVIRLSAALRNIPIYEYTPLQVKVAVTGYGRAEKHQMQEMTRNILRLSAVPKPDDAADALAVAITHGHTGGSRLSRIIEREKGTDK